MTSFAQQKPKQKSLKRLSNTSNQNSMQDRNRQLAKIIEFLRLYYLKNPDSVHLTLDEILEQCENLSLDSKTKQWLISEALPNNRRIDMKFFDNSIKFHYKSPLQLKCDQGRQVRTVLNVFKTHYETYDKQITVEDVQDSIINADWIIRRLKEKEKIVGYTGNNKEEVLIYNDQKFNLQIHSHFLKEWRTVPDGEITKEDIRKYLHNHGYIAYGKESNQIPLPNTTSRQRKQKPIIKQNQHIANQLEVYTNTSN
ncbi:hypothetical protein I4U23_016128 [Adineta vaga]|nr:hypothetical protein I4U23_016128 [Adineta vaga]